MKNYIAHVDVNSAYVSWSAVEALRTGASDIDYRTIPSVVGGNPETRHGIVLAKSIPAKKYGIQTAELVWQAVKKCPHLKIIQPDAELYTRCSAALVELVREYSDRVLVYSIDELFIDLTGMQLIWQDPLAQCNEIRRRIKEELGFTVSVGLSSNFLLAKMGSDMKKPDATTTLFPEEIQAKMWPLPVEELFYCGPASTMKLKALGISTIGELAQMEPAILQHHMKSHGRLLWEYANGLADGIMTAFKAMLHQKGVGNSSTIWYDVVDRQDAALHLLSLCECVGLRLRGAALAGRVVEVGIRYANSDYTHLGYGGESHQRKLNRSISSTMDIYDIALQLLDEIWDGKRALRNFAVRVSECSDNSDTQLSLFESETKHHLLDRAVDALRERYGKGALTRACFLHSGVSPITGVGLSEREYVLPVFSNGADTRRIV
ncbi:MAG: DNA polymerase IV [Symbiobacteriaceae bacterium]|nr:DNA polymerase IV [Symbiobacteriaceae bacterium]